MIGRLCYRNLILVLLVFLAASFALAAGSGRVDVGLSDLLSLCRSFLSCLSGLSDPPVDGFGNAFTAMTRNLTPAEGVFLWIRLPRCLMAVLVGAGLAVSGAVYQALFRNPLVSPDILGVSAGCTFGAALGLMLPFHASGLVPVLSFGFGLFAVFLSMTLARLIAVNPLIILVLAGMVVLSFFNALLMALKYFADPYDTLPSIIFWVMGSFNRVAWPDTLLMAPFALTGLVLFILLGFRLNILSLGDLQARSLGVRPARSRRLLIAASSLIVAISVSACGQVAWIGLIVPHMARALAGPSHEAMILVAAILGACLLLLADTAARSLFSAEIPVGIITALTGAPVFGYLLYRNRGTGWH